MHSISFVLDLGESMEREKVTSSAIVSIGYESASEILEVEFPSGAIWQYLGISQEVFDELMAGSIGGYFQANIRGKFQENQVA
jgi:hypothetical protein